jgi:hypothetical protein
MNHYRNLVFGLLVAVGVLAAGRGQDVKSPWKDVVELAREAETDKDVAKKAAALKKKRFNNAREAMRLYNPRSQGGLGFGPRAVGIEAKLVELGEDGINAETLKKESAEWKQVARINLVMAEIIGGFAPAKPFLGRGKKEWERDVEAWKTASRSLLKAVEDGSAKEMQAAAARINNACNNCHDGKK